MYKRQITTRATVHRAREETTGLRDRIAGLVTVLRDREAQAEETVSGTTRVTVRQVRGEASRKEARTTVRAKG